MKRLGNFNVNPKNIMSHDELLRIKGGRNTPSSSCNNICTTNASVCSSGCNSCVDNPNWAGMKVCVH